MNNSQQIRLEIPSTAEYVGVVRRAVEGIASRMHFAQPDIDDVKLAVGEACTNAIRHGCPSRQHPFITIICKVLPDSLEIEIRNSVTGGQPCPTIVSVPDTSKEGGMGLFIMRKLMDEVDVIWKNRTASVRMVKRMRSQEQPV